MRVRVVITGRSYDTSANVPTEIDLPDGSTVRAGITKLESHLAEGATFPTSCLVAVSGRHIGTLSKLPDENLRDNDELMIIAPVAGG